MAMFNYESEALYQQVKGEALPSTPVYVAECKKEIIDEVSPNYPQLVEYEKEWLNFAKYYYHDGTPVPLEYQEVDTYGHASVANAIPFCYKSAILNGQTLVNIVPNYVIDYTATNDWDGFYGLAQPSSQTGYSWEALQDIKPNTKYFISCNVETFDVDGNGYYLINNSNEQSIFSDSLSVNGVGHYKWLTTSNSELTDDIFIILRCQNAFARGAIKIKDFMIIEYQNGMENWDIPYFEGMKSVQMPVLTTNSSNLIPPFTEWEILSGEPSNYSISEKRVEITLSHWNMGVSIKKQLKPNTIYTVGWDEDSTVIFNFIGTDKSGDMLPFRTFTTGNTGIVTFALKNTMTSGTFIIDGFRIYEGNVDFGYAPFKSNILTVNEPVELRGIGEVKDELNLLTGELTQRIGEIVLNGSHDEGWLYQDATISCNMYLDVSNLDIRQLLACDKFKIGNALTTVNHSEEQVGLKTVGTKSEIVLNINKSKLSEQTADGFKIWLSQHPLTIQYRFTIESVKTDALNQTIKPYEGTNHYQVSSDTIPPQLLLSVPVVSTGNQTLNDIITEE